MSINELLSHYIRASLTHSHHLSPTLIHFEPLSSTPFPASKYWPPGHPKDDPLQRPQDVP